MQNRRKFKRLLGLFQVLLLALLVLMVIPQNVLANPNIGLGDIGFRESYDVAEGVTYTKLMSYNANKEQKAHTIELAPGALKPVSTYGVGLHGGETMSQLIALEEAKGSKVVAAINGDFYDTSNSVPTGAMIINGQIVTSGNSNAIGFKADGTVVHGATRFRMFYNDGEKNVTINHFNKARKDNASNVYLYSNDYSNSTKTTYPGTEVVLEYDGEIKIDKPITATVKAVNTNATDTPIGINELVISVANASASKVSNLVVGKQITININDVSGNNWAEVEQSIGAGVVLAKDGVIDPAVASDSAIHPRTAVGIRADGSVVLLQVDGRQPGYSNGVSYKEMHDFFVNEMNVVHAYNLDGGGSSTIAVRLPGNEKATVQNSPSDGGERSNANGFLFLATTKADPEKQVAHIHAYPHRLIMLEDGQTKINVKATDKNYYPVSLPSGITYEVSGDIGSINEDGVFTAKKGAGNGKIIIRKGDMVDEVEVTIVDQIDKLSTNRTIISIAPNTNTQIEVNAYKDHMPITLSNKSLTWSLSDPNIGEITEDGLFKGKQGTGELIISYKTFEVKIPVEVGRLPKVITSFEGDVMGKDWRYIIEQSARGGKGSASITDDEDFVRFGKNALKIDYDFRDATGTTGVTVMLPSGYMPIEGYPTHIGMWVYGDGKGVDVRMQLRDGNDKVQYLSFGRVDYVGWKYVESEIPEGLPTPLSLQYPIRALATGGVPKAQGTLYIDYFRAVYGFKNDDFLPPKAGEPIPAAGTVTTDKHQTISLNVFDDKSKAPYTGINKDSIELWINNKQMDNVVLIDEQDGSVTINYTPNALKPYRVGPQDVKIRFEDNYGNISYKTWQFIIEGDYVDVFDETPDKDIIYAGETFKYLIKTNKYSNFERVAGSVLFNNKAVEIQEVKILDSGLAVHKNSYINAEGIYEFDLSGMDLNPDVEDATLIEITFRTKEGLVGGTNIGIVADNVAVYETNYDDPRIFKLKGYDKAVDYKYRVSYVSSTVGQGILFKITDDKLNPLPGLQLRVEGQDITVNEISNAKGEIYTESFKDLKVGSTFKVYVSLDGVHSQKVNVEILPSLGTASPYLVIVTAGENASNSVVLTWQTDLFTTEGMVQYREVGTDNWKVVTEHFAEPIRVINSKNQAQEYMAHKVVLQDLKADTEYEYQVGTVGELSELKKFKTAKNEDELDILFISDPQSTSVEQYNRTKTILEAAFAKNGSFDLGLIGGDVMEDVNRRAHWEALEAVLSPYLDSMIWSAASGNHDVINNYGKPFIWSFSGPDNGVEGVLGSNYFFEVANIAIAVLDTETPSTFEAQKAWLLDVMGNTEQTFKFVLMHRGVYPAFNNDTHIRDFYETFDEAGIDLVLSGHDHLYHRTVMYDNKKADLGYGSIYITGGTTGAKFYSATNHDQRPWLNLDTLYDKEHNVYSIIKIRDQVLTFEAYALEGNNEVLIDSFTLDKEATRQVDRIELQYPEEIYAASDVLLNATIYGLDGEIIDRKVKWELLKAVDGVSVNQDGKLVVTNDVLAGTTIELKATFSNAEEVITITVLRTHYLDALEDILNQYLDTVESVLK